MKSKLEKTITNKEFAKYLRKQHNHNELERYGKIMDYYLEIGFDYKEARNYARGLLRK